MIHLTRSLPIFDDWTDINPAAAPLATAAPRRPLLARLVLALCIAGAALSLAFGSSTPEKWATPIAQLEVGANVITANPTGELDLQFGDHVDPAAWRKIELLAPKTDGSTAEVTLLRPVSWLAAQAGNSTHSPTGPPAAETAFDPQSCVGRTIKISVPECGIHGAARVLSVSACPPIASGSGRTVIGKFIQRSAKVIDLTIAGEPRPIGTTANHPFWSETHNKYVRADALQPNERVRTLHGVSTVTSSTTRPGLHNVYNIEVLGDHTYHVAGVGVLVHNGVVCETGPYSDAGGHHVHAKAAFRNDPNYDLDEAFCLSQNFMSGRGWDHQSMTNKQRELFGELAASGRPNTLQGSCPICERSLA